MPSQNKNLVRSKKQDTTPVSVRGAVTTRSSSSDAATAASELAETRETNQLLCDMLAELKKINIQLEDMRT